MSRDRYGAWGKPSKSVGDLTDATSFAPHYVSSCGHSHAWGISCSSVATPSTPAAAPQPLDVETTFATEVRDELARARSKFGPVASLHEGYAVILEELDEFWEDVRANDAERLIRAYRELVQVAAMAQRTAEDAIARLGSQEGRATDE